MSRFPYRSVVVSATGGARIANGLFESVCSEGVSPKGRMPEFDTRNQREPGRPRKFLNSTAALFERVANHPRARPTVDAWRGMERHRRRRIVVVGAAALLIVSYLLWSSSLSHSLFPPSRAQLPEYESSNAACPGYQGTKSTNGYLDTRCFYAFTDARDRELLALIAEDVSVRFGGSAAVTRVDFLHGDFEEPAEATAYYFVWDEDVARSVLTEEEIDAATIWHGAYVFRGEISGEFVPSREARQIRANSPSSSASATAR
jgi:hypothetical protein